MEEPASVEALRNAKAELLTAEAQYRQAETAYLNAQTAYQQALADNQVLLNKMEELNLKKLTAQTESEILALEQQMEELKLDHQVLLLGKKFELAQAEQEYLQLSQSRPKVSLIMSRKSLTHMLRNSPISRFPLQMHRMLMNKLSK